MVPTKTLELPADTEGLVRECPVSCFIIFELIFRQHDPPGMKVHAFAVVFVHLIFMSARGMKRCLRLLQLLRADMLGQGEEQYGVGAVPVPSWNLQALLWTIAAAAGVSC